MKNGGPVSIFGTLDVTNHRNVYIRVIRLFITSTIHQGLHLIRAADCLLENSESAITNVVKKSGTQKMENDFGNSNIGADPSRIW